nr:hypothetical protein [Candidatus Sigynarchaeota archaeon]
MIEVLFLLIIGCMVVYEIAKAVGFGKACAALSIAGIMAHELAHAVGVFDAVFKQDATATAPRAKKTAAAFADLEASVPPAAPKVKPATPEPMTGPPVTLRVREMSKRRRPAHDDDILNDTADDDPIETSITTPSDPDEGVADKIDPLETLSHRD